MKALIIVLVLLMAVTGSAYADVFQFIDRSSNSYLISYAVYISEELKGYTDGYGRIRINKQNGAYSATLRKKNSLDIVVRLSFDGSSTLKTIYVP